MTALPMSSPYCANRWSIVTNQIVEAIRRRVEGWLPWFDRADEDRRAARTDLIRQRSIAARVRVEAVIAEYREADARARRNVEAVIGQYRAADDERR